MRLLVLLSVLLLCFIALFGNATAGELSIIKTVYDRKTSKVVIEGQGFGRHCKRCELLGDYGKFAYSLSVESWQPSKIVASVPNFGISRLRLQLVTTDRSYRLPKPITVNRHLTPKKVRSMARKKSATHQQMFEFSSSNRLGDKGVHEYEVHQEMPSCNSTALVYHDASLLIGAKTRFADAKIVKKPNPVCQNCSSVSVEYYVEPAGFLHYQLLIQKERVDGLCPRQLRKKG